MADAAKPGDEVKVHYTGKLDDGTVFDTSADRDPLAFTLGEGHVIAGFEEAVKGMQTGERKTVTIPAADAYGERTDELVLTVDRQEFPDDISPEVGQQFQLSAPSGQSFVAQVTDVSDESVTLDANSPLAGKDLTFDIELVAIN